ncbi:permease [Hoeflea sp. BAL378]|uniref:YeeE/YedE family protein n=1 Tax=Hoeflea sp. BAL378 TaxID=1547437 RepID=UPI000512D7BC|nr:YeeE/YedE family protein [Hoeflea sp. BAL378]KGF67124.1 permease [Hoeflea sp. BAL378]
MAKLFASLLIGAVFGLGIAISGMANPAKVLNFFDVAGAWDPSLIFVMGGALVTTALGYRLVFGRRQRPLFDAEFHLPVNKAIDTRLLAGSATFGIGWGIAGFCPGGAIPALGFGGVTVIVFTGAMMIGIVLARSLDGLRRKTGKPF